MEKCVLFGAGKIASKIHEKYKEEIVAVIDNDPSKIGLYIWDDIPIISLKDYKDDYSFLPIMITTVYCKNIEKQLRDNNITNFFIPDELWRSGNVEISHNISHSRWPSYLKQLCDYEGKDVLEVDRELLQEQISEVYLKKLIILDLIIMQEIMLMLLAMHID